MPERIEDPEKRFESIFKYWLPIWMAHAMTNFATIRKGITANKIHDMAQLKDAYGQKQPVPALILGSGPSLDDTLKVFGERKEKTGEGFPGIVFAGASNAVNAIKAGIHPNFIGAYDAHPNAVGEQLKAISKIVHEGTTLVTHPCVSPSVFSSWKNRTLLYAMNQPQVKLFDEYFQYMYPFVRVKLLNFGCTLNNLIELATFMGCDPIFIAGADFGFPENQTRCTKWELKDKNVRLGKKKVKVKTFVSREPDKLGQDQIDAKMFGRKKMQMSDAGIWTTDEMVDYKISLMSLYRIDKAQIIQISHPKYKSIITELPKITPKMVISTSELKKPSPLRYLRYRRTEKDIIETADEYLENHGVVQKKVVDEEGKESEVIVKKPKLSVVQKTSVPKKDQGLKLVKE